MSADASLHLRLVCSRSSISRPAPGPLRSPSRHRNGQATARLRTKKFGG